MFSNMDFFSENIAMPNYVGPLERGDEASDECGAICRRAVELIDGNRKHEAIELLERSVAIHPDGVPLHQLLAQLYLDASRVHDARREILRLQELGYRHPRFLALLGAVLMNKREFAEGIVCFREARASGVEPGEWLIAMAEALLRTGRLDEAEGLYEELLPIVRDQRSRMLVGYSALKLQRQQFEEAATLARDALKERKVKYRAFYFLGLACMRMGEAEFAVAAFERFVKYQPHRVAPYRWLERYAREADDDDQADAYNLKAREILENRRLFQLEKRKLASRK